MKLITNIKSTIYIVLLFLPILLNASIWMEEKKYDNANCCSSGSEKKIGYKELIIKNGNLQDAVQISDLNASKVLVRDFDESLTNGNILDNFIEVATPNKGSYHIFFEQKNVENNALNIVSTTIRVYNKDANIKDSVLKEIRGRTVGSHYDKPPLKELDFEVVMLKPIRKHQINCCLWSGDIARFKIYYKGVLADKIPLKVFTQTGWNSFVQPGKDGVVSFEIPRTTYKKASDSKRTSEKMIVEANYTVDESGEYLGKEYSKVKYSMTMPLTFSSSPLEYSSQLSGFYVVIGVMLVFAFGAYYYRKRKQKFYKEIWFEED